MSRDQIYSLPQTRIGDFTFDDAVADVFPDMIARSVPGYSSILSMIEQLASRFIRPGTNVYDLGCSLGAATMLMRGRAPATSRIYAIDNSPAMVARLKEQIGSEPNRCDVVVQEADICDTPMSNASFVVMNLTLQFVSIEKRTELIQTIYDSLIPGGAMLLSEKIRFDEHDQNLLMVDLHHDFKLAHGYSELEIAQKRTALENRLLPESIDEHTVRLRDAGFRCVAPWFQCFNFASILAVKMEPAGPGTELSK
ncbi:tRNA (cmo5U34)-methyltransferase [Planctomycetes bacterium CA13]|uniref:Carboxy-S-adenosyl-L-methionine synthase n=1 Tax=Novipirellula herctigrandis TaxID=2527986 RepID=A0A5C5YWH1_9BACT|nr:tRNA (cmo5U34)-methyltransferase [Planctomycetes bacterium CA13]